MSTRPPVSLSALDTARWQSVTARASSVTPENLPAILGFCREHAVRFLIARCAAGDLRAAQAMESAGFRLMDTLVYYARALDGALPPDSQEVAVRELAQEDAEAVRRVAAASFAGYAGHYHADPRLDRAQCDAVYVDWAYRSCLSRELADAVLGARTADGAMVAFATMRLNGSDEGEGVLFGVAPEAQGRGIYRSLILAGMRWCKARGCRRMVVSTQVTNVAVQKVWTRLGFEPARACYTFHKWLSSVSGEP